jgi:hypothetical protein
MNVFELTQALETRRISQQMRLMEAHFQALLCLETGGRL